MTVSERARSVTPARGALVALAAAQVAHGRAASPRPPAEVRRMLLSMLAASAGESVETRGPRRGLLLLSAAGAIGFCSELLGVSVDWPFGRYSYSGRLGVRIGEVPVLAAAAWAIMSRPAWVAAGWISSDRRVRIPVAAAALSAWDVYLDPRMVEEGYWRWARRGRYAGIPASNFAGWFVTGCAVFCAVAALDAAPPSVNDDGALALYTWTWVGEAVANGLLWRRRLPAVAGAAAMGSIAVPALRRRRRRTRRS